MGVWKVGAVLLGLVAVGMALPLDSDLDSEWQAYKSYHTKKYSSSEESLRRLIWEENLKRVALHNLEAAMGKHTYTLAMNEFADLSGEEFAKIVLGSCVIPKRNSTGAATFLKSPFIQVPTSVDWRDKNLVTPIKDQKQCGSCWAFSTTGSLEGQHSKKTGKLVSLSEQQLVDCSGKFGNFGCMGGLMDNAFRYIKANGGIDTEASYPYEARDGHCRFKPADIGATVAGYTDVPEGDEAALTQAIAAVGPISVAIDASHFSFQLLLGEEQLGRILGIERLHQNGERKTKQLRHRHASLLPFGLGPTASRIYKCQDSQTDERTNERVRACSHAFVVVVALF